MTLGVVGVRKSHTPTISYLAQGESGCRPLLRVLETIIIPWMKKEVGTHNFVFQQDSARCHTARKTLNLLKDNKVSFWDPETWPLDLLQHELVWTPSSKGSLREKEICRTSQNSNSALKSTMSRH
ncbi:Uncharacterized protein FKW44_020570 [Caligus rogercresseyi]|uniref:Uncharacterized protein n=1 Tax=Caligus rogercresseyi TaxID=217165 RepID=A0A7T8JY79_CALRO|nr:Uncharacterized protein FKW44_020570 [Caligus rogercresseyi]